MMCFNIDLIIVVLFLIVNFAVGFGIRRKRSVDDFTTYSIGNFKDLSVLFLTASSASYIISGGIFINLLQQSYNTGITYVLKNSVFQPLAYILVAFFVFPLHKNWNKGNLTLNEWIDEKFHSSFLRALLGLSEFLLFLGILVLTFKAFGTIAKALFNLPPQYEQLCVIGFAIFLSLYTAKGGFLAITLTDILQFWVFIIAFVCLVGFVVYKSHFFAGVWDKGIVDNPRMNLSPCFKDYSTTMFTLSVWIQAALPKFCGARYQRIMMSNNSKKVKKSILYSVGIVVFFMISCICISLLIYSQNPNLTVSEILPYFVNNYCPTGLKGLLGAGLLAMSISTTEAMLCSNSVVLVNDIVPFFYKMVSKKKYTPSIFMARVSLILLCCLSVFISFCMKDMFTILMVFNNFYCPVAIIPSVVLVLGFNVKKTSVISGIFCGILATILDFIITKNLSSCFFGITANLVGLVLTELILRMRNRNNNIAEVKEK